MTKFGQIKKKNWQKNTKFLIVYKICCMKNLSTKLGRLKHKNLKTNNFTCVQAISTEFSMDHEYSDYFNEKAMKINDFLRKAQWSSQEEKFNHFNELSKFEIFLQIWDKKIWKILGENWLKTEDKNNELIYLSDFTNFLMFF